MKIRAGKINFHTELTEEDLKCQILNDMESPEYPQVLSNNECAAGLGEENKTNDSPLSFLVKFKASFISPPAIQSGVSGIEIPEKGLSNIPVRDDESHFQSVNINHHDLTLASESDLNELVKEIRKIDPPYQSFQLASIKKYIKENLDDPEWKAFYVKEKKWRKFKNNILKSDFETKHCSISYSDMEQYIKTGPDELEVDLIFLKKHDVISDTKKIKVLQKFFPEIYL